MSSPFIYEIPLPFSADNLIPHRPPMRLVREVVKRNREDETGEVHAIVPDSGMWIFREKALPEYLVELTAQAMAAVNGYDLLCKGEDARQGLLVGVDRFSWMVLPCAGAELVIKLLKKFEMYPVTIMEGRVSCGEDLVSCGELKVWELNKTQIEQIKKKN